MKLLARFFSVAMIYCVVSTTYAREVWFSNRTGFPITLGTNKVSIILNPHEKNIKFPLEFEAGQKILFSINSNGRIHITTEEGRGYYQGSGESEFALYFQDSDIDWVLLIDEDYSKLNS